MEKRIKPFVFASALAIIAIAALITVGVTIAAVLMKFIISPLVVWSMM